MSGKSSASNIFCRQVVVFAPLYGTTSSSTTSDNPCEMFNRLEFPTNEFFPPTVCDIGDENKKPDCGCK